MEGKQRDKMSSINPGWEKPRGWVREGQARLSRFGFPKTLDEIRVKEIEQEREERKKKDAERLRAVRREREMKRKKEYLLRERLRKERLPKYGPKTGGILRNMLAPNLVEDFQPIFAEISPFLAGRIIREIDPDRQSEITPKDFFNACLTAIYELKQKHYVQRKRVDGELRWVYTETIPVKFQFDYEGPTYGILRTELHRLAACVAPPEFAEEVRNLVNKNMAGLQ